MLVIFVIFFVIVINKDNIHPDNIYNKWQISYYEINQTYSNILERDW